MKSHAHRWRAVIDYIDEGSRELTSVIERAGGLHETIAHRITEQHAPFRRSGLL
ncbi:MAG TPA: hypothetical protein VKZ63_08600 [Kofleriaceae bacterium]|nr:hypothetical protein [Kofleriaceae bacterium]